MYTLTLDDLTPGQNYTVTLTSVVGLDHKSTPAELEVTASKCSTVGNVISLSD